MTDHTSRYLIDERPLTVQPTLVKVFGLEQAVILQQFHWLLGQPRTGVEHDGQKWIWGTYEQWCDDYFTFWPARTLRYHMRKLKESGVLITKQLKKQDWDRTNFYTIDYKKFDDTMRQLLATSIEPSIATSIEPPIDASNGQAIDTSYIEAEKTTDKSTEKTTQQQQDPAPAPPSVPQPESGCRSRRDVDTDFADVCTVYENEIGLLTDMSAQELGALVDEHPKDWIIDAIRVAVRQNARKLSYVSATLTNWKRDGRGGKPAKPTTYANGAAKPATADLTFKQWLLKQYQTDVLPAIFRETNKAEKELRNEYNQWRTGMGR